MTHRPGPTGRTPDQIGTGLDVQPPLPINELLHAHDELGAERDTDWYAKGVKITDTEMDALPLHRHDWHSDWNYTLAATPNA